MISLPLKRLRLHCAVTYGITHRSSTPCPSNPNILPQKYDHTAPTLSDDDILGEEMTRAGVTSAFKTRRPDRPGTTNVRADSRVPRAFHDQCCSRRLRQGYCCNSLHLCIPVIDHHRKSTRQSKKQKPIELLNKEPRFQNLSIEGDQARYIATEKPLSTSHKSLLPLSLSFSPPSSW